MVKCEVQQLDTNKVALLIEVGKERVHEVYTAFFATAAKEIRIPGFRQGRIPRPILEKHIGPDSVRKEIQDLLIKDAYPRAIQEHKLHPVSDAEIEDAHLTEGQPFTFKAIVETRPNLPDFKYRDLELQVKMGQATDEGVEKVLKNLQERYAKTQPVENRGLESGDYFLATVAVKLDGEAYPELSKDRTYLKFAGDVEVELAPIQGIRPGEERTFTRIADRDGDKDTKHFGKPLEYHVSVERISAPTLPELNDEFAKEVGDFADLAALKTKVRDDLHRNFQEDANNRAIERLLEQISSGIEVAIPEAMIRRTLGNLISRLDRRWRQYGTSFEEYLSKSNQKLEEFMTAHRSQAIAEVKVSLVLDAIATRENITVDDQEFRQEVERMAGEYNMTVDKLLAMLQERGAEEHVRDQLLEKKIREFLLKNNAVRFDIVSESELQKGEEQGDAGTDRH